MTLLTPHGRYDHIAVVNRAIDIHAKSGDWAIAARTAYAEASLERKHYLAKFIISEFEDYGFVIVPKEPTRAMLSAVADEPDAKDTWGRMIAAAKGRP